MAINRTQARLLTIVAVFAFTASLRAEAFCALRVRIISSDGTPARLTPVRLIDPVGKVVFDQQVENSELSICDFGFGPHKLAVGYGFCYPTTISGIELRMGHTINLIVRLNECAPDLWRSGCSLYFRIRETTGSPLEGVSVSLGAERIDGTTDRFGRIEGFLMTGTSATALIKKQGFTTETTTTRCEASEEIEKDVAMKRAP